jgi:hypothetical protein
MRWWHWSECSRSGSRRRAPATVIDAGHKGRGYVLYLAYLDFLRAGEMPYDRHFRQGLPFLLNC